MLVTYKAGLWFFLLAFIALYVPTTYALPIGFGRYPAGQEYYELKSKNFYIYHDKTTPTEAQSVLNALEAARPHLEQWFGRQATSPLPVILSATTDNASFANFITDAIELQTMGQGYRDLAWHEYVHTTMYRHFHNWLGPAGSILHLIWLPSWYVEGLAEALSVSIGSDQQALVERYHAMTGRWPSFNRLHSLYSDSFSFRGYATSGSFVSYLLREKQAEHLPQFLNEYFHASMPWYWPYSILPFKKSMPLDNALAKYMSKTGADLYEDYKKAAIAHYKNLNDGVFFVTPPTSHRHNISRTNAMMVSGNEIRIARFKESDGTQQLATLKFAKNQWAAGTRDLEELPSKMFATGLVIKDKRRFTLTHDQDIQGHAYYDLSYYDGLAVDDLNIILRRPGSASHLIRTQSKLLWQEQQTERTSICSVALSDVGRAGTKATCSLSYVTPQSLAIIGSQPYENSSDTTQHVWLKRREQSLQGDRYTLMRMTPDIDHMQHFPVHTGGEPVALASTTSNLYLLAAERDKRSIRKLDRETLACISTAPLGNLVTNLFIHGDQIILPMFNGENDAVYRMPLATLPMRACYQAEPHASPLLVAMNNHKVSLVDAMKRSSLWASSAASVAAEEAEFEPSPIKEAAFTPLDKQKNEQEQLDATSKPAAWRGRPIFAVPWLGADSDGAQLGVLSVPLMDHMQNEEVRAYFGYGLFSNYPNTEISLMSTRFWPTLKLDVFRYQTWNGRYFVYDNENRPSISNNEARAIAVDPDDGKYKYAYMDEKGARFTSQLYLHSLHMSVATGMKTSHLERYMGPSGTREGTLYEPFIEINKTGSWHAYRFTQGFSLRVAPDQLNSDFDYNVLSLDLGMAKSFAFLDSNFSLGLEGSRTRGKKRRELQEVYRPLKIFVPGSGSGYNNLNFPLYGSGALFSARYGDTQARVSSNYTFPIIKDIDKLIRLFYWDSLSFTAFFNYGGAWDGAYDSSDYGLLAAHGYALDAHFDIKGVNFNLGTGVGQVFGRFPDLYASFAFNAIF